MAGWEEGAAPPPPPARRRGGGGARWRPPAADHSPRAAAAGPQPAWAVVMKSRAGVEGWVAAAAAAARAAGVEAAPGVLCVHFGGEGGVKR